MGTKLQINDRWYFNKIMSMVARLLYGTKYLFVSKKLDHTRDKMEHVHCMSSPILNGENISA